MKKRILSFALALAMVLSMATVAFATDWETPIDVVNVANVGDNTYATLEDAFADAKSKPELAEKALAQLQETLGDY